MDAVNQQSDSPGPKARRQVFDSLRDQQDQSADTTERLHFVSGWFRVLGFVVVALWVLAGVLFVFAGVASRQPGQGLLIGVVGSIIGILITAPLYFWFAAIAAGVAALVERSKA